ncbi:fasciclin domain-containing protein [Colletotrichum navitas]|uniref:Fasciclin domain-containing protein n=1 Tax=Colletotrichum navitas TaxID=681940 RepID=A0AAD8PW75_9PEZI|nr:fasciclin domain-containing protein [Colletotrichum navitas]KAK1585343.1 fasciclin domain-containing protein [Colletotrichum navitas]
MRDGVPSTLDSAIGHLSRGALNAVDAVARTRRRVPEYHGRSGALQRAQDVRATRGQRESVGPSENRNVFEIIRQSGQATYFARLLESHTRLRDMLDDGDDGDGDEAGVFTVLVPTDAAFRELEGFERSEGALLGAMLEYHVLEGRHSADELGEAGRTLPTVLAEGELGGRRQRVRVAAGRAGAEVNFHGRVVGSESTGRNGVIHFIDSVLVPPPRCAALVGSLAGRLGTFARALRETGVAEEMRGRGRGLTLLVPSDEAWHELGAETRGFLFSRAGRAHLRALVRYHVAEEVLYTDEGGERRQRRVGTLLGVEDVSIDFGGRDGSRTARVNGVAVSVGDVPARDGVVHVLDGVLLPPARGTGDGGEAGGEGRISVQGLKRRLGRYVEGGDGTETEEL